MLEAEVQLERKRCRQLMERLRMAMLPEQIPLSARFRHCPQPVAWDDRLHGSYQVIVEGEAWGRDWDSAWFHLHARVPEHWQGATVVALLDIGGEGLVYLEDGSELQGISVGGVFDSTFWLGARPMVPLLDACAGGEAVELWLEAASLAIRKGHEAEEPGATGRHGTAEPRVQVLRLARFDRDVEALYWDLEVLSDFEEQLTDGINRRRIRSALARACDHLGRHPDDVVGARSHLQTVLCSEPADTTDAAFILQAVGQAHLDTAWLWPRREMVRKFARTAANQLRLMERYPEHVFGASSAYHYQELERAHPRLMQRIAQRVREGRWEVHGGMWVETDANLPDGESLVRQLLYGKRWFQQRFGIDVRNAWLPDVFGYSPALPQIMREAGCDAFLTQKLSWSKYNAFPHKTFRWRGIDGSEVLTHFPPENTYCSNLYPRQVLQAERQFPEGGVVDRAISLFGHGDGGGGPHERQLERARRLADGRYTAAVRIGPAQAVLDELQRHTADLPCWDGELYLEEHRGTLTSQARLKWFNRHLEQRLRALEIRCVCERSDRYPRAELTALWQEMLVLQFHDILPGSSITTVNAEALQTYRELLLRCEELERRLAGPEDGWTAFNSLDRPWRGLVRWPHAQLPAGVSYRRSGEGYEVLLELPEYGSRRLQPVIPSHNASASESEAGVLENGLVRYQFDAQGRLLSCWHKGLRRELIDEPSHVFTLYNDRPTSWDAWNIDRCYRRQPTATLQEVVLGSTRYDACGAVMELTGRIGSSRITERLLLVPDSAVLHMELDIDWQEDHQMLRLAFPLALAGRHAVTDCAYGHCEGCDCGLMS